MQVAPSDDLQQIEICTNLCANPCDFFCILDVEDLPVKQQWGREEKDDQQMRLIKFNCQPSEDFSYEYFNLL